MKSYEKYKPSGVEWIGEIPEYWKMLKVKYVGNVFNGSTPDSGNPDYWDGDIVWITPADISQLRQKYIYTSRKTITREGLNSCGTKLIPKDSIVLTTRAPIGNVALSGLELCTNQGCKSLLIDVGNPVYQYYQLHNSKELLDAFGSGTTFKELSTYSLKNHFLICPPHEEQTAIADYLDKKTAQIDTLIAKKQKLIELLKEERTALINQAVTKGINPEVKLKPSGIDWLGDIPEHWEVKKLKYVLADKLKYGANEPSEFEEQDQPQYIRITDFGDDGKLREDTFKSLPFDLAKEYLLKEGDLLFARSGATVGKTFQFKNYNGVACFAGYLIKASPNENQMLSNFLYSFTKSGAYENWKNSIFNQATIQNIGADKYSILEVPVPPIEEQRGIIAYIETETQKIDTTISKIEKEIGLMQEYRTALISEVVTGKIKVV